ncbi:MAG: ATP-dependent DNA helicase, partial [Acidimicrobiales bacterium]
GLLGAVRALPDAALGVEARGRRQRALQAGGALLDDLDAALAVLGAEPGHDELGWVEGEGGQPRVRVAPLDVAPLLAERLWTQPAVVLTSATLPSGLADRLGLAPGAAAQLDVGSPFDYPASALLYCAAHLPDPRSAAYEAAAQRELEALIVAAGGRTLALFTSWRAMRAAADALATRLPWRVLTQAELPKPALLAAFAEDETSCLFATMSFWQGVDVVGPSLSLVVIDRLPFPRPDDPLLSARRDRAGPAAFRTIDLPRAGALLAQGAGRLIRSRADRGVVAVLDRRLATAASYRWELIRALPPMRRTKDPAEAAAVLRTLRDERTAALTPSVQ